ncbi:family 78 glycoside hydrolase catalytic domain [Maribacter sp. SA7]|uniref:family 78 glycoside hydrolase catalytic domain n=1 Tax=Maribacter zhoushanensis TaxID=3030012 RepID=UPI0023EAEFC9|nr:family 78 glycoside hydrolase catalytic domain [Maribacter zhoushanensis]MDF4202318.1 family 78 glycoside hydrolase catalytic domain [Maribacter zhoushanensis]
MKKHIYIWFITLSIFCCKAQHSSDKIDLRITKNNPVKITQVSENNYLVDFGKAFFGTVELRSTTPQNDSLIIHLGEKLNSEHRIDQKPGASIRYQKIVLPKLQANNVTSIDLIPNKKNTSGAAILLQDTIGTVMPFRYCEIENLQIPIEDIEIVQKAVHNNFNDSASNFTSSNEVLDSIWKLCKHTIKATSFIGYYVDGDRERIPYEADAYINQLSHYSVDSLYDMSRRTNSYFIKNPTWPTEWLLHTVPMFYADYMYTGNLEPLREHYENLKLKTLMDLEREDGLISSSSPKMDKDLISRLGFKKPDTKIKDIIDWPPAQKDTGWKLATAEGERDGYEIVPVNTVVNAFYYYNLKLMTEIAGFLDKEEDVLFFKDKAANIKNVINNKLLDKDKGYYVDGENSSHASLHGNMMPLAFDLVPKEHIKSVTDFIKTRGMACSVYGSQYLLEGLYKSGEAQYALDLITETENDRSWWNMIEIGATMTLEAWDVKYKPNSDWNHAWGTAPLNITTRYMWGIKPKTPGFEIAEIKPQLADLTFSTIKVPTKKGIISASFKKHKNTRHYTVEIPNNMTAQFIIPHHFSKIKLNGKKIKRATNSLILNSGNNTIEIQL